MTARLNATLLGISAAILLVMMTTARLARGIARAAEPLTDPPKASPRDRGRDDFDPWEGEYESHPADQDDGA